MAKKNVSFDLNKLKSKGKKEKPKKVKEPKVKAEKKPAKPFGLGKEKSFKLSGASNTKKVKEQKVKEPKVKGGKAFSLGSSSNSVSDNKTIGINGNKKKTLKKPWKLVIVAGAILVISLLVVGIVLFAKYSNEVRADGKNIDSVYISAYPTNATYYIGDENADYSGLKLGITLKNGTNHYVEYSDKNASEFTFRGFDSSAYCEQQTITVTYKGYDCQFDISIKERPQGTPILSKISLETLPKTEYMVGEWLSTTGGVILLEYKNHAPLRVNLMNKDVYGWEEAYEAGPGTYTLKVVYVERGVPKETTYDITIKAPEGS